MSTKVRYILALGGYYKGADAVKLLSSAGAANRPKTPHEFQLAAKAAGGRLWMFREPRNIPYRRSRYQQLCAKIGIGKKYKVKTVSFADLVHGGTLNGTNPIIGHATVPDSPIYYTSYAEAVAHHAQQAQFNIHQHGTPGGHGQPEVD